MPLLFFSRQIGLSQGQAVPVVGGVRLTGRAGAFSVGALNIQTEDKPSASALATNFSALRLKRNLLRRSNVGVMATRRGPALGSAAGSGDASYTAGVDATMLFFKSINITSYYALTSTPDAGGATVTGSSYRGRFDYNADRYGATAEHMLIDADFRPEVGYVRRTDIRRSFGQLRFSPRPRSSRLIRKFTWQGSFDYVTDASAVELQSREASGTVQDRLPVERSVLDRVLARVRVVAGPIHDCAGCHRAGGRVFVFDLPRLVFARPTAARVGTDQRVDRIALRRHEVRRVVLRALGCGAAVFARAERDARVGIAAIRRLHRAT